MSQIDDGRREFELTRRKYTLRRELRSVEQELCGFEGHGEIGDYVEWGSSGNECKKCGKRFPINCHRVGCKCEYRHQHDEVK